MGEQYTSNEEKKHNSGSTFLKECNLSAELLKNFYHYSIESVITYCITAWYANSTEKYKMSLSRVIRLAKRIIGLSLPPLDKIFNGPYTRL